MGSANPVPTGRRIPCLITLWRARRVSRRWGGGVSRGRFYRASENAFNKVIEYYGKTLNFVLDHQPITLLVAAGTLVRLDCAADAPVTLMVNGVAVARGDLVVTDDDELAVEISDVGLGTCCSIAP